MEVYTRSKIALGREHEEFAIQCPQSPKEMLEENHVENTAWSNEQKQTKNNEREGQGIEIGN
jgi:hypothetical protein